MLQGVINYIKENIFTSLKNKIIFFFSLITFFTLLLTYNTITIKLKDELKNSYFQKLTAIRETKKNQIEEYFKDLENKLHISSENPFVKEASKVFIEDFQTKNIKENTNKYHEYFKKYIDKNHFYDLFIIDIKSNNIVYSVEKESDYKTNLINGEFKGSNLATLYKEVKGYQNDKIKLIDFQRYEPSNDNPAAFLAKVIFNDVQEPIAVLAIQLSIEKIDSIMTGNNSWEVEGLGKSGETYIIAEDCSMRNNSRFFIEDRASYFSQIKEMGLEEKIQEEIKKQNTTVLLQQLKSKICYEILSTKNGIQIVEDYRGVEVLSAYTHLKINGVNWVLLSEIDKEEAFKFIYEIQKSIFLIGIMMLGFIIIATVIFSNRITKQLEKLVESIKAVGKGDFSKKIKIYSNDEIGQLVKHFNQSTEELEIMTEKAKASSRAKSEFLANMSHEIRTPLNAILGFVEFLIKEEREPKKLKYLNIIDNSSITLLGVINDILDFSKIESGKLDIDKIDFNLVEELEATSVLFCAKAEEKQLCFSSYIDENIPISFYSDPLRIKQVLSNLLSNAIKFSKNSGDVTLDIRYIKENSTIKFCVNDTGIGISKKYQESIFDAFSQEELSTTRKYGGTGLGLAISSKLVSLLGGELKVKSEIGEGSSFYFELPIENSCPVDSDIPDLIKNNYAEKLKIATVFSEQYSNRKKTLYKYLTSIGIDNIVEFDALVIEQFDGIDMLILDAFMFEHDSIQEITNAGLAVIVIKSGFSESLVLDIEGKIHEMECPINILDLNEVIQGFFAPELLEKAIQNNDADKKEVYTFKDKKVLLVEDNKSNQMFMSVVLEELEVEFTIASDGLEAIKEFKEDSFDIVLMDENMPNMNGIEATKEILQIEKENNLKHTPIIALTANSLKGDREKFLGAGMDEYITKPLNVEKLHEILNKLL